MLPEFPSFSQMFGEGVTLRVLLNDIIAVALSLLSLPVLKFLLALSLGLGTLGIIFGGMMFIITKVFPFVGAGLDVYNAVNSVGRAVSSVRGPIRESDE